MTTSELIAKCREVIDRRTSSRKTRFLRDGGTEEDCEAIFVTKTSDEPHQLWLECLARLEKAETDAGRWQWCVANPERAIDLLTKLGNPLLGEVVDHEIAKEGE